MDLSKLDLKALDDLSPAEKELAFSILKEYADKGKSDKLDDLLTADYEELPVDIEEFLHNPDYLGKGLTDDEGRFTVFPYWVKLLKELFPTPLETRYNTLVLSGAIGLGKSFVAVIAMLYLLYRMLCLKDPYKHYGLQPIDHITFSVMNITLDAAKGVAWSKLQELVQLSPWFLAHGTVSRSVINPEWQPGKNIELIFGSQPRHVIGRAVFASFEDEISFQPNSDIEKQKKKARELVSSIDARMSSRFMRGEKLPTLHILASSKRTDQSFLETYIDMKRKNESKTTKIVDEPQWVVRTDKDSPNKFAVAVGNKFLDSEVLPLDISDEELDLYRYKGFTILMVPMGYYEQFLDDIDIALTDIAGISTSNNMSYISGVRWAKCRKEGIQNPFTKEILEVGNGPEDKAQYADFFDMSQVDKSMITRPLFIHLDMSISGDKTGIAGVWIKGKKPHEEGIPDSKELFYKLAFSVSIKAPKGRQISFEKNRQFIYWLKEKGFNIKGVSFDTFNSVDLGQALQSKGFETSIISVDRVKERVCLPYLTLKNAIYEERLEVYKTKLLTEEVVGLVRDGNGKIDHSPAGINCLAGDTLIALVDGRTLTMKDLIDEFNQGKTNYVYSVNEETGLIEAKPIINAFKSGVTNQYLEVVLDNDEIIRCTPEHRFMLRDGRYIKAEDLKPDDSLMPLYRKISQKGLNGYRLIFEPKENVWHFEHRKFAVNVFDEKYLVHHINCNKLDNTPDNLIWMSKQAHTNIHADMQTGACSIEARAKKSESIKKVHERAKTSIEGQLRYYHNSLEELEEKQLKKHEKELKHQNMVDEINNLFNIDFLTSSKKDQKRCLAIYANYKAGKNVQFTLDRCTSQEKKELEIEFSRKAAEFYGQDYETLSRYEKHRYVIKYLNDTVPGYKENIKLKISENHKKGKYKNAKKALTLANKKSHEEALKRYYESDKYKRICDIERIFNVIYADLSLHEKRSYGHKYSNLIKRGYITNHRVKEIRIVDQKLDVYDLTIKDNPNFATAAGVFVHNSKDQCDGLCGALYNASLHAEQFAYDYGEQAEEVLRVNNAGDMEDAKQLTLNLEEELKHFNNMLKAPPKQISEKENDYFLKYGDIIIL